ncbi:hypothetical protein TNCV_4323001 [Trichonephila clavipes]|nr:hypothetical protein TNCV_4323001 [Trichonephila clavipes]
MVEVKPINISLNQHSPSLSVGTAISPTLTEEFIIHPSVYSEIEKLGHAKSDVLLSESGSSLSADCGVSFPNVSVSILCKKANCAMKMSSVEFISRLPNPLPMKSNFRRFSSGLHGNTAADSVRSEWPLWHAAKSNAVFARRRIEMKLKLELVEEKQKLLDIREKGERERVPDRKNFDFDQSLDSGKKAVRGGDAPPFLETSFNLCRDSPGLDEKGKKGSTAADSVTVRLADCGSQSQAVFARRRS